PGFPPPGNSTAIHFIDPSHGLMTVTTPIVAAPQVCSDVNGVWTEVSFMMPPGVTDMSFIDVRMVSQSDAWAIAESSLGGMIVHLRLPNQAGVGLLVRKRKKSKDLASTRGSPTGEAVASVH